MKNRARGFTLIELLAIIAIISLLFSFLLASLNNAREKARVAQAQATVNQLRRAITVLAEDTGEWPGHKTIDVVESGATGNEIWDLSTPNAGIIATDGAYTGWNGPYISTVKLDPWGNPYFFDTDYDIDPSASVLDAAVVGSFGPNGQGQNIYDSYDIIHIFIVE
jgi:general secretion pathway protein G